ncbi:MAG: SDR family oxidoreductase [Planctomycetes bacterium]|nr:SDR family oxidoreductase [Planctomycetota bacterium]
MADAPPRPVTVVTGSSRGIGAAIAEALARAGHRLVLTARDGAGLEAVAARLRELGTEAIAVAADLRTPGAAESVIARATAEFGAPDVVISNAGTAPADKIEKTTDAVLRETFELHVGAPLAFARAAAPAMKARGSGCLLHLASTAGLRGFPFTAAYTAAKHGMVGLARALRAELAPAGIAVYALCPGFVDTAITRQAAAAVAARGRSTADEAFARMAAQNRIGRMHTPAEVAAAAAELVARRPDGCVYDLDRDVPGFVD